MSVLSWDGEADDLVVGSGAGGATVAVRLAEAGREVAVLEEGERRGRDGFTEDLYGALRSLARDFGAQAARGRSLIPVLEGRVVGGTTVMSGSIMHRLPEAVHAEWEPEIRSRHPFADLERHAERLERDLSIRANLAPVLASLPAAGAVRSLGWEPSAMRRAAPGCQGSGRCLQGCPTGGKGSMEASFLPRAERAGARILPGHRALRVLLEGRRATGILARRSDGALLRLRARRGVWLCAGTVQTPLLLARSAVASRALGRGLQCHLGIGVAGLLDRPRREVEGPPQGIEVMESGLPGVKIATQLLPPELMLARAQLAGRAFAETLRREPRLSCWTASVRAVARGSVRAGLFGRPSIRYEPAAEDLARLRAAAGRLARILLALGAREIYPGIAPLPARMARDASLAAFDAVPLDPRAFPIVVGHSFGTCRMGGDPASSVVGPDFRVHGTEGLRVADASVLPTNLGVNPQLSIMTLASRAAELDIESVGLPLSPFPALQGYLR